VFALTRQYYLSERPELVAPTPTALAESPWPDVARMLASPVTPAATGPSDPVAIAREADELFTRKQYAQAAQRYEQLLALDSGNVDVYNNLGITLHYLGRSEEALRRLAEGAALDPQHQRLWLTTGFVNLQLGSTELARAALTKAIASGNDSSIRESAEKMLASLP
jgi:Tfp pilus assembly protein PilF